MDTAKAAGEMENLLLTDLIDIETLRRIQDSFSDVAGVASLITDREGGCHHRRGPFHGILCPICAGLGEGEETVRTVLPHWCGGCSGGGSLCLSLPWGAG